MFSLSPWVYDRDTLEHFPCLWERDSYPESDILVNFGKLINIYVNEDCFS